MDERLSLSELQLIIRESLYMALPDMYWVIAEISEIKENYNGHCYLELIEKSEGEINIRARVRGVIWSNRYRFLKSFFENSTGESLKEGLKVLVKVRIEYHEIYGLSLVINDIDPAFTIGEMAVRRQQILKKLDEDGVLSMNKDLDFPVVPQRIAVISSVSAAGYTDFTRHLQNNSYGYVFYTALFDSPMQGNDTEAGIIRSLDKISLHTDKFDIVVIIRGGGSQTDLSWFDNYNIAYYITQFPLPVLTGIGHEKDLSVTDIVAWQALKTPTAVADFLIECMANADNQLVEMSRAIIDRSLEIIEENRTLIDSSRVRLIPQAKMLLAEFREQLSGNIIEIINTGKEFLMKGKLIPESQRVRLMSESKSLMSAQRNSVTNVRQLIKNRAENYLGLQNNMVSGFQNSLKILDPENILKRGYTITSRNGIIIKSASSLSKNDKIDTKFSDGSVQSTVN